MTTVAKFVSEVPSRLSYGSWKTHVSLLNILNSYLCRKQNQTISKTELLLIFLGGLASPLAGSKHLGSVLWLETEDVNEPNWNPFLPCQVSAHNWALSAAGEDALNICDLLLPKQPLNMCLVRWRVHQIDGEKLQEMDGGKLQEINQNLVPWIKFCVVNILVMLPLMPASAPTLPSWVLH